MSFDQRTWAAQPPNLVQSVQRALRVLEVVAESPDGIPAKAIARRLNLALSTTYHILHTLVAEGYVVRLDGVRGFGLGYKLPALNRDLARVARLGLGADVEEFQPGLACVAAPVAGADGAVTGAISVSVPVATLDQDRPRLEAAVREGAARVSRALAVAS